MSDKQQYPNYAIFGSFGRVRILEYIGRGYFRVLTNKDDTYRVHRRNLRFI